MSDTSDPPPQCSFYPNLGPSPPHSNDTTSPHVPQTASKTNQSSPWSVPTPATRPHLTHYFDFLDTQDQLYRNMGPIRGDKSWERFFGIQRQPRCGEFYWDWMQDEALRLDGKEVEGTEEQIRHRFFGMSEGGGCACKGVERRAEMSVLWGAGWMSEKLLANRPLGNYEGREEGSKAWVYTCDLDECVFNAVADIYFALRNSFVRQNFLCETSVTPTKRLSTLLNYLVHSGAP